MWVIDFFLAILNEFARGSYPRDISSISERFAMDASQRERLKNALQGLVLKVEYDGRHMKFVDVGQPARVQRFQLMRDEKFVRELTVEEYFAEYKNIRLHFPNLPVLVCGKRSKAEYYPMELMRLSDKAQRVKKRLTPVQLARLIRGTALSPLERFKRIDWFLEGMKIATDDEFLQNFGVSFPSLNEDQETELEPERGSWRLDDQFVQTPSGVVMAFVCVDEAISYPQFAFFFKGTALSPLERFKRIDWFLEGMKIATDDEFLQNFGVSFPSLNENQETELEPERGSWRLDDQFVQTPSGVVMAFVCVDEAISYPQFAEALPTLIRTCEYFGFKFADDRHNADSVRTYQWNTRYVELTDHVLDFKKKCANIAAGKRIVVKPILVFIVAQAKDEIYGMIKTACDQEEGIACQVVRTETFMKMRGGGERNTVARNLCMKINAKLGGINNELAGNRHNWQKFTDERDPTLFIGIDVTHPPSGDTASPSVAAVVGSLNIAATRYAASIKIQHRNKEKVAYVVDAFRARIVDFELQTGRKPQHIVVLRDGVSDTEFLDVMNEELLYLKSAAHQLAHDYKPTVSYAVIQKRHHTRFMSENDRAGRRQEKRFHKDTSNNDKNVPPGTVVDRAVTSCSTFDFYLCSHYGALGTSKPAHYTVLYDSWQLTADEWQAYRYILFRIEKYNVSLHGMWMHPFS
ncbi:unnamed protein product [Gongylonema pulchrum]|uniref:Piwi domain-containing protein n=1 Tax=Gongylonema pulchrum TaxID=637853 RepID=A0A183DUK5_9BILA|nr:unnamed protein product [Gongylonema pulchrum]